MELIYVQGSVIDEVQRLSVNWSYRSGPPRIAPVSSFGFGEFLENQLMKLLEQLTTSLGPNTGTEAPLWCA